MSIINQNLQDINNETHTFKYYYGFNSEQYYNVNETNGSGIRDYYEYIDELIKYINNFKNKIYHVNNFFQYSEHGISLKNAEFIKKHFNKNNLSLLKNIIYMILILNIKIKSKITIPTYFFLNNSVT